MTSSQSPSVPAPAPPAASLTKADAEALTAQATALKTLVPSLSGLKNEASVGAPIFTSALTYQALDHAAQQIASRVTRPKMLEQLPPGPSKLLVTTTGDFAGDDTAYWQFNTELAAIEAEVEALLPAPPKAKESKRSPEQKQADKVADAAGVPRTPVQPDRFIVPLGTAAIGQVAVAGLNELIPLLSTERAVTADALSPDELAATAAVGEAIRSAAQTRLQVIDDATRLITRSQAFERIARLQVQRTQLAAKAAELKPTDPEAAKKHTILVATLDAFVVRALTIPKDGSRSLLTRSALHEVVHGVGDADPEVGRVLMLHPQAGQSQQVLTKRLWRKPRLSNLVHVNLTYVFLNPKTGLTLSSGTVTGQAAVRGKVGDVLQLQTYTAALA